MRNFILGNRRFTAIATSRICAIAIYAASTALSACGGGGGGGGGGLSQDSDPNVQGDTQTAATAAIAAAGLTVGTITTQSSSTVASGDVISQSPSAGTSLSTGSAINLVISSGPAPVAAPNVVGDTQAAAITSISVAGLVVGSVSMQSSNTVPPGSVISEIPAAGTMVASGSVVNLVVSSGAAQVAVPNVIGDTEGSATTAITGAGLVVGTVTQQFSNTMPSGQVISETPAAGTSVESGAPVNLVLASTATQSPVETVMHIFGSGTDGITPDNLIQANDGNFYGVTINGGNYGFGTVFEIKPAGVETVLYSFGATDVEGGFFDDGESPSGIVQADDGNFYVTCQGGGKNGYGSIVKITPAGGESLLYSFAGSGDAADPTGALLQASDGNLYGTASSGGTLGKGSVFKISLAGAESVLYSFTGGSDASSPTQGLIQATDGNLYGITYGSGANGWGTVFRVTLGGVESVVYAFTNGSEGSFPTFGVIQGTDGSLYGMTEQGGQYAQNGGGTLFRLTLGGNLTVVHSFGGLGDANLPAGSLVQGSDGNLYGTTTTDSTGSSKGKVFAVNPSTQVETIIYTFEGGALDGDEPWGRLMQGSDGALYGTTEYGGSASGLGSGTVFKVVP